jgi:glutamyl-tRNA synthetase
MSEDNIKSNLAIANLIFGEGVISDENKNSRSYFESFYKKRDTTKGQEYTRIAPSPTGELHSGALYMAMIDEIIANKSGGKCILRIEDTDSAREIDGARDRMEKYFKYFKINIDESYVAGGDHGPYIQSKRVEIYKAFVYDFLVRGYAYPCFMTSEELDTMREEQTINKVKPGVYGKYAKNRDLKLDEISSRINSREKYVIRLKSYGDFNKKIKFTDEVMGDLELSENDEDFVIAKNDGVPTYHLAHLIDDYLMGVTFVVRANEWVASITKHLELWFKIGVKPPKYGHLMPINKKEGNSIRKLSKRKDPEASVEYFIKQGYTVNAVKSYLMRLANPSFDDWWISRVKECEVNKSVRLDYEDYEFNINELKRNSRGPLMDFDKLDNLSSDIVASMSSREVLDSVIVWSESYDEELSKIFKLNLDYVNLILNIERETLSRRKDIKKWSDVRDQVFYFFDELYEADTTELNYEENIKSKIREILSNDIHYNHDESFMVENENMDKWMSFMKEQFNNLKEHKDEKDFKNMKFGEFMMVIRRLITKRERTPNLYYILKVLGKERVMGRVR